MGVGGSKRKNVGVKAKKKRVGSWGKKKKESKSKSKSPWTALHGSLAFASCESKENPTHFNEVDGVKVV